MSLYLFELPKVAIREVLKLFKPEHLFFLSICSQKSAQIIQSNRQNRSHHRLWLKYRSSEPEFRFDENFGLPVMQLRERCPLIDFLVGMHKKPRVRIGGLTVPYLRGEDCLETFWEDKDAGLKALIDHLNNVMGVEVHKFDFKMKDLGILEFINGRQALDTAVCIQHFPETEELLTSDEFYRILRNDRIKNLEIQPRFVDDFVFEGDFPALTSLNLNEGQWVTIENLKSIGNSCTIIEISCSKITSLEINQFLQYWVDGGMKGLKCLSLEMDPFDLDVVVGDLPTVHVNEPIVFRCEFPHIAVEFSAGNAIQRDDKAIGSISYSDVLEQFYFVVGYKLDL